jgi:hypothetical protein
MDARVCRSLPRTRDPGRPTTRRTIDVPPGPATYRLEQSITRDPEFYPLSIEVSAAWTFRSRHTARTEILALPALRFQPQLDAHNQTAARILVMPIAIARPVGAATPRISRVSLEVSFDDGATWSAVPVAHVDDRALAVILHRPGAAYVSLRGSAADADGNQVEQTIVRAYGLAR